MEKLLMVLQSKVRWQVVVGSKASVCSARGACTVLEMDSVKPSCMYIAEKKERKKERKKEEEEYKIRKEMLVPIFLNKLKKSKQNLSALSSTTSL